ncbi:hypothetical protein KBZ18_08215 [Synechococcus sp. Cruz-9H2]|uniref:hypothetical protein n=1 Tax=unclassified Synechococcus TaxID=2626047 RepID=UPI0020CBB3D7|nr:MULTISPECIES: hypothetical protein [unclassified Synechococcus]MCP9819474.1 hypothetical protein [Synechococcus sp. Cruz-9H2]MCP9843778.1 hypothetical protein [Synechococcus sp. Edmonson 11F2]MCP9855864.1 hypothetical protein [Synechococcus sp. Cruz-9C9]MCP9863188.1 hypothetical protein [Synechococcus sp. Cruz-7E5]MCP9870499.1 hypothetical protein [Synechococcus sp. Cruz-7B9]
MAVTGNHPVIALGIDAPNADLLLAAMDDGDLPFLARMREQGAIGTCTHTKLFRNESCWDVFLSGQSLQNPGSSFDAETYCYANLSVHQKLGSTPLFYSGYLSNHICVFDLPAPIARRLNGVQITGWGSELNACAPMSQPEGLLAKLEAMHGLNPRFEDGLQSVIDPISGLAERSVPLPSLYVEQDLLRLKRQLLESIRRRTAICADLLQADRWDLFLALYSECHTANHMLWHLCHDHPLGPDSDKGSSTFGEIYREIDSSIAKLHALADRKASFVVYTIDHTVSNRMDVPTMALLPELLYRWAFPGQQAIGSVFSAGSPLPSPRLDYAKHWKAEVWTTVAEAAKARIASPFEQEAEADPLSWNPANWYKNLWPRMRAFALPSVSDGYVRLNVCGREAHGLINPAEFGHILLELRNLLLGCVNPRTGRPLVHDALIMRDTPLQRPDVPPDLVVRWSESGPPADALECEEFGRIGPLPFFRSGGHVMHGTEVSSLLLVLGPAIQPGTSLRSGRLEDVPATILTLAGLPLDENMDGESLI